MLPRTRSIVTEEDTVENVLSASKLLRPQTSIKFIDAYHLQSYGRLILSIKTDQCRQSATESRPFFANRHIHQSMT